MKFQNAIHLILRDKKTVFKSFVIITSGIFFFNVSNNLKNCMREKPRKWKACFNDYVRRFWYLLKFRSSMQVQVQSSLPSSIRGDRTLKRGGREGRGEEGRGGGRGRGGEGRRGKGRGRGGDGRGSLEDLLTTRISEWLISFQTFSSKGGYYRLIVSFRECKMNKFTHHTTDLV